MTRDGQREDEAEMVTETGKAHAGIDPEIISLASGLTEEGTRVRAVLAQKAMGRTQAMVRDDTHEGKVAYRMEDDLDLPREIADAHGRKRLLHAIRERLGPVADVARQLEELADCAHAWEGVRVAAGDLRGMARDLRKALRGTGVEG